jgi:hypothetical protein
MPNPHRGHRSEDESMTTDIVMVDVPARGLTGAALDWAVAMAEGLIPASLHRTMAITRAWFTSSAPTLCSGHPQTGAKADRCAISTAWPCTRWMEGKWLRHCAGKAQHSGLTREVPTQTRQGRQRSLQSVAPSSLPSLATQSAFLSAWCACPGL